VKLSRLQVLRTFVRSFFIQAGFNPQGLQTLGLVYALEPVLKALYPDPHTEQQALERHLTPFNTHPYVAAAFVGGIVRYEQRIARGTASPEDVARFKSGLMGPLAALGDGFFWLSLRPLVSAVGVAMVPVLTMWSVVLFVVLYNVVHLTLRAALFRMGLDLGEGIVSRLAALKVPAWSLRLRWAAVALVAGVGAWLSVRFGAQGGPLRSQLVLALGCLGFGGLAIVFAERRVSPYILLYALSAVAVVVGAIS